MNTPNSLKSPRNARGRGFLYAAIILLTVVIDQITKYLAVTYLKPIDTKPLWEGVLHLTYVTNKGAAFGILADRRWIFLVVSTVAIILLGCYLFKERNGHPLFCTAIALIVGGGIGNMIDRTALGYVIDFIDFRLINFAVFNGADSFVCVGCALVFIYILFFDRGTTREDTSATEDIAPGVDDHPGETERDSVCGDEIGAADAGAYENTIEHENKSESEDDDRVSDR